jgi:release factor glutamine methyltransferase
MIVAEALAAAASRGLARLDAQLLLLHALGREQADRAWLLAHDGDAVSDAQREAYLALCEQRMAGAPVAYLVGYKEFYGLPLQVDPRVLVPRPETETLVEWALEVLGCASLTASLRSHAGSPSPRVIDLGTGSGAIALAIKKMCPGARVIGTDASADAVDVARANAAALALDVEFQQRDWLGGIDDRFDLILSNPPYVAAGDPHLVALEHEPISALAAGPDGLDDIRTIALQAPARLLPGGWLLLEHGWDQAAAVRGLLAAAGLAHVQSRRDLAGIERCSGGQRLELG